MADDDVTTATLDIDATADQIGADLFPASDPPPTEAGEPDSAPADVPRSTEAAAPSAPTEPMPPAATVRTAPKSWAKEMHEHWAKTDPKVQEYIEKREKDFLDGLEQYKQAAQYGQALQQVLQPYHPLLQQKGLDAPRAVADLMDAYVRLTQGTPESRWNAYQQIARNFGLADPTAGQGTPPAQPDPALHAIQQELQSVKQTLTAQQQAALQMAREKAAKEVEAFAADQAHAYFDEVADHILTLIQGARAVGKELSLQDAYDQAVWANPVTRAKELARLQTEWEAKLKENARLEALPKKKAASVNVRSRDTQRTPTEPLGTMDDTLRDTMKLIKSR